MSDAATPVEKSRESAFAERIRTRIWQEEPAADNPWLAERARIHGYALDELISECDYPSLVFLLFRGELPDARQRQLMRRMLVAFCNPGTRHDAVRATMNAAASGTHATSLLPIGLSILGGDYLGSEEVDHCARFIARQLKQPPAAVCAALTSEPSAPLREAEDRRVAPGFGSRFGAIDPYPPYLLRAIIGEAPSGGAMDWTLALHDALTEHTMGCLLPAVVAAVCLDLGFPARSAGLLYQLASAPGIAAHALEMRGKGPQAMPFVDDSAFDILCKAHES